MASSGGGGGSAIGQSIQFDEGSLRHKRNASSATAATSRYHDAPSSSSSSANNNHLSHSASNQSMATTSTITRSQRHRNSHRNRIVTTPAWASGDDAARMGDDYDYAPDPAPTSSTAPPTSPPSKGISRQRFSRNDNGDGSGQTASDSNQNGQASRSNDQMAASSRQTSEPNRADDETLGRFWTFTLPTKYRNRLHEHHLRMLREKQEEQSEQKRRRRGDDACSSGSEDSDDPERRDGHGAGRFLQGLSGALPTGIDSHYNKRRTMQQEPGRRADALGMGEASSAGVAAGFLSAEQGMSSFRKRQQQAGSPLSTPKLQEAPSFPPQDEEKRLQGEQAVAQRSQSGTSGNSSSDTPQPDPAALLPATEMRARIPGRQTAAGDSFTRHQAQTPGWESPWRPERGMYDESSSEDERSTGRRVRGTGFFPRSDTRQSKASSKAKRRRQRRRQNRSRRSGPAALFDEKTGKIVANDSSSSSWSAQWSSFLLHNPFAPLLLRVINICFTTSTLAIAIRIFHILRVQQARDSVGASPLMGIIIAPLSLVHVGAQVWLEYWGRPIGLWGVGSKLGYQLIELIFIALWSAELALTLDNYATSTLVCVNWYSPYSKDTTSAQGAIVCDNVGADVLLDPSAKPSICRLQGALIGLTFTTLVAYVLVFAVSLFRTVSRK